MQIGLSCEQFETICKKIGGIEKQMRRIYYGFVLFMGIHDETIFLRKTHYQEHVAVDYSRQIDSSN